MSRPFPRRIWPLLLAGGCALAGAAGLILALTIREFLGSTGPAPGPLPIVIHVPPGTGLKGAAAILARQGIIRDENKFCYLARWKGAAARIQAGEFAFTPGMTPEAVLDRLVSGQPVLYSLTIPEGYNLNQIAEVLDQKAFWSGEEFLILARSPEFAHSLGIPYPTLEGYLFPDTYRFPRTTGEAEIIRAMVHRMELEFPPAAEDALRRLGLSRHEALTLASIVEKETGLDYERPLVAAVFLNRLRKGMRLQSDPTVIYGIKDYDGNLRRKDLETWNPYNTYRIAGLPPGPIAGPGAASIRAVLKPAATPHLYFVSRGDGSHVFSSNLRDHNRAVNTYQRGGSP